MYIFVVYDRYLTFMVPESGARIIANSVRVLCWVLGGGRRWAASTPYSMLLLLPSFTSFIFCRIDSIMLLEEGFQVTSIDFSDKMLKHAQKMRWNRRKEDAFDKWGKLC